ncbi:TerB family tellurite resistance protein [Pelagimonas varians]|uniref:Tellurite resistance protein TerB n=1 Tax=Pelagimonas varians TaxID=696760 RepID=A0A238KVR8_9RHOB|nr:TerB family tellurite resistance protein [Pelagimonas varians]PYG28041.1 putative tellurite resistance protein B-like protein [Pelagimonas varians]SMX46954.1 Tellurite resistance protein TerB [Pelagimonas varians]
MFGSFLTRITAAQPDPLAANESSLALTALLVRVARSDGAYAASEKARIDQVVTARFNLSDPETKALRAEAETLEAEAPDTVRFTRAIKEAVPFEDRVGVIEALWQVALSDGERDQFEDALVRLVASMLGVSDRDSALARQRVERSE